MPHLSQMTWQEAEAALTQRPIILLPIGATEAHGPHLPLDTDVIIAEATAAAAAVRFEALGIPTIIAPALAYTVSFVGLSFAGTIPTEAEPFQSHLTSILAHLTRTGSRGVVICNAHLEPAHVAGIESAVASVRASTGVPVVFPDQRTERFAALLSAEFRAGARHAGSYETSIVLAARPECVRLDVARALPPVWIDLPAKLREGATTFAAAGASLGYFGDPARSTAEEGEQLLRQLAEIVLIASQDAGLLDEY